MKVAVVVCGDFNSTSRSGVYEYMRTGFYDFLKLDKSAISGQVYGTYDAKDCP
jgi:endonuclease/exonuclease/phosphatase family metal-dependent hydrolase